MYTTHRIFPVLSIKHLINQYGESTTSHKLSTGKKTSVSNLCVLFRPYVVQKKTAHVDRKALNMCHQSQNGLWGIFVLITQQQIDYVVYLPSTWKIVSSRDVVFDKKYSSELACTPGQCSETLVTAPEVSWIPYATYSHEQTGDIIDFALFKKGDLLENKRNLVEDRIGWSSIHDSYAEDISNKIYKYGRSGVYLVQKKSASEY